jgi:hypothetical protein
MALPSPASLERRNVWLIAGGEMTSHGEFRRGFADRFTQFLRKRYSCRRRIRPHGHSLYQDTFPSTRVNRAALSPEVLESVRRQLSVRTVCWMWTGPLFVAQKSQVEILIVVMETAPHVPNCVAADPLFRIAPKPWPRFGGAFSSRASHGCCHLPRLRGGRGFGERAQHRANLTIARES